ncbi:MAG TPA: ABC transporter permease [Candidatus Acidoferrales bacterium]|nr:ABC transporter permease [Candidatus Acidoferrales bacterium]
MRPEHWLYTIRLRLRSLFRRRQADQELDDELRDHIEQKTAEYVAKGMTPREAHRTALLDMGGVEKRKEECRDTRRVNWVQDLLQDLRFTFRMLCKSLGFTAVAVLTLALGIGANTAIFSLINAVLLQPLPGIANPKQLASLFRMQKNDPFGVNGYPDYVDYRDRNRSFSGLAAHAAVWMNLGTGSPERIIGDIVTGNYFPVLGVQPALGRLIVLDDDTKRDANAVVVLSYSLWERKFGSSRAILGRKITLNGYPFIVIGVAPPRFTGVLAALRTDVWVPMSMLHEGMPSSRGQHYFEERAWGWMRIFGRLKPGVSFEQAQTDMRVIARQLALAYPITNTGHTVALECGVGIDPDDRASLTGFLGLLFAAVGLLLVIACANIAGLLLVRATGRRREISVRLALGATRGRLIRQLVTEGLFMSFVSGALGLILAPWIIRISVHYAQPTSVIRDSNVSPDARVLAFTLLVSILAGVAFTVLPALRSSSPDILTSLKEGAPRSSRNQSLLQRLLAAAQVGASFVLLIAAGLLFHNMYKILNSNPGFDTTNIFMASINLTMQGYENGKDSSVGTFRNTDGEAVNGKRGDVFYHQLLERLTRLPQVSSASLSTSIPPNPWPGGASVFHPGEEPPQNLLKGQWFQRGLHVNIVNVSPYYFQTLGIPLMQGRDFDLGDDETTPGKAIVSRNLAERMWPGENAIGKRISWPTVEGPSRPRLEVVGVAADCKYLSLTEPPPLIMYVPLFQNYSGRVTIALHTTLPPAAASAELRSAVAALDKTLPVFETKTMQDYVGFSVWQQKIASSLIGAFGLLAVFLAALGLYGVLAHSVSQRTHEIGIRMALGAQKGDILWMVIREGLLLAGAGVIIGMGGALALTRFLRALLFEITPTDPAALTGVALLLALVALLACYIPARRAMRVDPMVALRYE